MEIDDLFRIPGQGNPYDIDGIPNSPLVSALIHPMATLKVTNDVCRIPEQFKAWRKNLGHEKVLTTFLSYGEVCMPTSGRNHTQSGGTSNVNFYRC